MSGEPSQSRGRAVRENLGNRSSEMKRIVLPIVILVGCLLVSSYLIRNPTTVEEAAVEIIPVSV
jgi:hypothetical protein